MKMVSSRPIGNTVIVDAIMFFALVERCWEVVLLASSKAGEEVEKVQRQSASRRGCRKHCLWRRTSHCREPFHEAPGVPNKFVMQVVKTERLRATMTYIVSTTGKGWWSRPAAPDAMDKQSHCP
jgi:hypothetical protein